MNTNRNVARSGEGSRAGDLLLKVEVGEYTVIQEADGRLHALRHNLPWRECVGDNLILSLASEVQALRDHITELETDLHNRNCEDSERD